MGLGHTAAMLSPEGLKTFVFAQPKLVPKQLNSRLGVRNLLSKANMAAARIRPISAVASMRQTEALVPGHFFVIFKNKV